MSRNRNSRKLLADAACTEFAQHGYAGARTDQIARRAGVNKQLLFYYFGSKAGLYSAVVKSAEAELAAGTASDSAHPHHAAEQLRQRLRSVFESLIERPDLTRLVVNGARERQPGTQPGAIGLLIEELAAVISGGQGLGYFRDDVDPEVAARQAVVLLIGYLALEDSLTESPTAAGRADWLNGVCELQVRLLAW